MYHSTEIERLSSILEKGIIPHKPNYRHITDHNKFPKGVYLQSKKPPIVRFPSLCVTLKINVAGLSIFDDPDKIHKKGTCFYTIDVIQPNRIIRIFGLTKKQRERLHISHVIYEKARPRSKIMYFYN